ncbi:MAG: hypothetical protein IGBAC_1074 [Ignavibacteriae bacterium]|nr:MAG: hypothetical protein IGBAC_1074 [Ignavibacteriota bacterium]
MPLKKVELGLGSEKMILGGVVSNGPPGGGYCPAHLINTKIKTAKSETNKKFR